MKISQVENIADEILKSPTEAAKKLSAALKRQCDDSRVFWKAVKDGDVRDGETVRQTIERRRNEGK